MDGTDTPLRPARARRLFALDGLTPVPCVRCGRVPKLMVGDDTYAHALYCDNCYDGAEDSPTRHEHAYGRTVEEALEMWSTDMAMVAVKTGEREPLTDDTGCDV